MVITLALLSLCLTSKFWIVATEVKSICEKSSVSNPVGLKSTFFSLKMDVRFSVTAIKTISLLVYSHILSE